MRPARTLLAVTALALLAAACGSEDDSPAARPSSTSSTSTTIPTTSTTGDPTAVRLVEIAKGLAEPVAIASQGEDTYVVERAGRVVRLDSMDGPIGVLDIRSRTESGYSEQGLLGLAFSNDGTWMYTASTRKQDAALTIEAYPFRAGVADASKRRVLMAIAEPQQNHNGGGLAVDAAGDLWIGVGDGGAGGDSGPGHVTGGNGQSTRQLLGKVLRITPTPTAEDPYTIPASNPFVTTGNGVRPEIYAYGLRNPWRFTLDAPTKSIWIADVGQDRWEEIDATTVEAARGANFGWNVFEGSHRFRDGAAPGAVPPVHEYAHAGDRCSIIGGVVVRDPRLPALDGAYLFSDYCAGDIDALVVRDGSALQPLPLGLRLDAPTTFGVAGDGSVLVASQRGTISRLVAR